MGLVGEADGGGRVSAGAQSRVQQPARARCTRASGQPGVRRHPVGCRKARSRAKGLVPNSAASRSKVGGSAIRSSSTARARAATRAPAGLDGPLGQRAPVQPQEPGDHREA